MTPTPYKYGCCDWSGRHMCGMDPGHHGRHQCHCGSSWDIDQNHPVKPDLCAAHGTPRPCQRCTTASMTPSLHRKAGL